MSYTISQVAKKTDLTVYTLRYYDKEGLLPYVQRSGSGIREFEDSDIEILNLICCLKNSGMHIKEIKTFINWCMEGDSTLEKRLEMFKEHRKTVEKQLEEIHKTLEVIDYKIEYYTKACKEGQTPVHNLNKD